MNERKRVAEEWIATDVDNRGRPRSFAIVEHEPQAPAVIDTQPVVSPLPPMVPRTTSHVEGSHMDRARAFGIETLQLSLVVGGLAVIMAWFLADSPLGLLTLALMYGFGFSATWLIAYLAHVLRSPEGNELYSTYRLWNFLDREQSHRWQRAGIEEPKHRLSTGDRVLLGLFLLTIMGVIVFVLLHKAAQEGIL